MCSFVIYLRVKTHGKTNVLFHLLFIFSFLLNQIYFDKKNNVSIQKISIYQLQEKPLQFIAFLTMTQKVFLLFPFKCPFVMPQLIHQHC